ncbi:hypothetical protein [Roseateles sp.]|uniref:hypothetical protein n=1 Tax=Roseateles sp. TaxID=1971397 RepID=UPI0039ECB125
MTTGQFSQIALTPWRQGQFFSVWGRWLIGGLLLLISLGSLLWLPAAIGWRVPLGVLLVTLHGAWMALASSLQEQNHPHAARCVPGHLRALRRSAVLGWALCSGATTLLSAAILPSVISWQSQLLVNGLIAVFLLWASRLWWLWMLLIFQSPLLGFFGIRLAPIGNALYEAWQANTYGVLLLSLLAQAWIVVKALDDGGARHRARYSRQAVMRQTMRLASAGRQPPAAAWGPFFERLFNPFELLKAAWMRRLMERADNTDPRNVMARAEIVLHGPQHWLNQLTALVTLVGFTTVAFTITWLVYRFDVAAVLHGSMSGIGIGIGIAGLSPCFALPGMLWQSRREQALLRLLPGMPQGAALNRAVASRQLRDFFVAWLLTMLALTGLAHRASDDYLLYMLFAALPVAALNLTRRPAMMQAPTAMTAVLPMFAFFALGGVLFALARMQELPLWQIAVPLVALTTALLAWRWRRLVAAPTALPAGRLA